MRPSVGTMKKDLGIETVSNNMVDVLRLEDEPIEIAIPDGAVILAGDPMPYVSIEEMETVK